MADTLTAPTSVFKPRSVDEIMLMSSKERRDYNASLKALLNVTKKVDEKAKQNKEDIADKARKDLLDAILDLPNQKVKVHVGDKSFDLSLEKGLAPSSEATKHTYTITKNGKQESRTVSVVLQSNRVAQMSANLERITKQLNGEMVRGHRKPKADSAPAPVDSTPAPVAAPAPVASVAPKGKKGTKKAEAK